MNDSSTGGYLQPGSRNSELNDLALRVFLQSIVVGITGMPGNLVRPRWQAEPPNIPVFGTDWAAIGVTNRKRDTFSAVIHQGLTNNGNGQDVVYRNQILEILASFYGPNAESNSELFAMGFEVAQNREVLHLAGFGLIGVDDAITTSELVNERWLPRIDVPFSLRRGQLYTYPVLNLIGATASATDDTASVSVAVTVTPLTSNIAATKTPLFAWTLTGSLYAGWGAGNWK